MRTFTVVVGLVLVFFSGAALAQSDTASLTGTVSCNRPNLLLTDLWVIARLPDQPRTEPTASLKLKRDGTFGTFKLPPLSPGRYDLSVARTWHVSPLIARKVKLEAGDSRSLFLVCPPKPGFKLISRTRDGLSFQDHQEVANRFEDARANRDRDPQQEDRFSDEAVVMVRRTQFKFRKHTHRKCYVALRPIAVDADPVVVERCPERRSVK